MIYNILAELECRNAEAAAGIKKNLEELGI